MQKKKVDRAEMEILMRPIVKEKKNEAQKLSKVQEKLKQADLIFRSTVDLIFPKKTKVYYVLLGSILGYYKGTFEDLSLNLFYIFRISCHI